MNLWQMRLQSICKKKLSWILSDMKVPVEEMAKMITQMRGLGMDDLFQGSDCTTNPYKIDK